MLNKSQTQIQKTAQILTQGFIDDPSFSFIFGENANKFQALNAFFELFATDAMERGKIIIAPEEQGACIWYPAEVEIFNEQFEQILAKIISRVSHFCGCESGKDPLASSEYLHPIVYRDLITNVVFLGAPSTGKTTIASILAEEFNTVWMPEYGREYWEQHQVDRRLSLEQLVEIAQGHLEREEALLCQANQYLFTDTNALTTYQFSLYYHNTGSGSPWEHRILILNNWNGQARCLTYIH